jgi:hypothetical protein
MAIESSLATAPQYVAYLPGLYTVDVTNSEGCSYKQDTSEGIEINQENQIFNVYAGSKGYIVVVNNTSAPANLNIYDFSGKLLLIESVDPGYNEVFLGMEGAFIISVGGSVYSNTSRIFVY